MEVTQQKISNLIIVLTDDEDSGVYESAPFMSSLPKLKKIINEIGYKNKFNKKEKEFWNEFFDNFILEEKQVETKVIEVPTEVRDVKEEE